jgi:tyrosinase
VDIRAYRHIGIGPLVVYFSLPRIYDSNPDVDAPDFYESSFWKDSDPKSGLGGWGDPNADYQVPDGGLRDLQLSYPSPHHVRRNFTLLSFKDIQVIIITDRQKIGNTSFSASVIEGILETPSGDYKRFQTMLEVPEVRTRI